MSIAHRRTLLTQLPNSYLILEDFNAKNHLWSSDAINDRGRLVENFLSLYQACVLNDSQPTHFHTQTATLSAIDLSIASPEIVTDFNWEISQDLHGSYHFPIKLSDELTAPTSSQPRFVTAKADWPLFKALIYMKEPREDMDVNEMVEVFKDTLHSAARQCMPLSTGAIRDRSVVEHSVPFSK